MSAADRKVGLALGGGGAKGLAHILALQVFDELGIVPHRIAGTSIGSIIGALYASGLNAKQIEERIRAMIVSKGEPLRVALRKHSVLKTFKLFDFNFGSKAILKGDNFMDFLYETIRVKSFEDLNIPLRVAATDFWTAEGVVIESGDLLPAVKASMALPGIFLPVERDGRVLIDGGGTNPLPYDVVEDCDITVAIDVMGYRNSLDNDAPNLFRAISGTFDIMQKSIIAEKIARRPPDIYIKPKIINISLLDFHEIDDILEQAFPAREKLRNELIKLLER